jgi:hypothetical protein
MTSFDSLRDVLQLPDVAPPELMLLIPRPALPPVKGRDDL